MSEELIQRLAASPVVPVVRADSAEHAVALAQALLAGGLSVIEIVLRTPAASASIEAISSEVPKALVGAGTVLDTSQAEEAIRCGAQFLVSPGLSMDVLDQAEAAGIPAIPGIATPTEVQQARQFGLDLVKLFPAGLNGGPAMLKAFSEVFPDMRFMPTGGISASNLEDYLALPAVLACGGSWLTAAEALEQEGYYALIVPGYIVL